MKGGVGRRKFQVRHDGADEVDAGDGLLELMIQKRQLEGVSGVGVGQAAARRRRVHFALVFVVNHQILEAGQLDRADSFVDGVKKMLDPSC